VIVSPRHMVSTASALVQCGQTGSEEELPAPALLIVGRVASRDVAEISAQFWAPIGKIRICDKHR